MKKSLLALATLTAFAGAASAQSSVVISGGIDLGVASVGVVKDGKAANDILMQTAGKSARSNLTFRGKEDLGGGMYASFFLNHRFNPQNGTVNPGGNRESTDNQFWRNSFVELGSSLGAIRLGRYLAPLQELNGNYDAFGTDTVGSVHVNNLGNVRANSAVEYRTPAWGGLTAMAMVASSDGQGRNAAGDVTKPVGFGVQWAGGPFSVAYAYDKKADGVVLNGLYGAWDFGVAAIMGQYEKGENSADIGTALDGQKYARFSLSTKIPFGAIALKAGWAHAQDEKFDKYGIGLDYSLSKRTLLYTDLGKNNGDFKYLSSVARDAARKVQWDVGIYHKF